MKEKIIINAFKLEAIDRLSPQDRKEGIKQLNKHHTYRDIAIILNIPLTTVYQWANGQTVGGKDRTIDALKTALKVKDKELNDAINTGRGITRMIDHIKEYTPKTNISKNLLLKLSVVSLDAARRFDPKNGDKD